MLRAYGATGLRLARSIASLIPTPASTHIFAVAGTLRVPLSQPQKRRKQPERYVPWELKIFAVFLKILRDKTKFCR
jgi:hypothetical protein